MFFTKKVKRNWLTATQSFTVEMLRAILKDRLKTDVYLTQISFKVGKPEKPLIRSDARPMANETLSVSVEAFFTSLDFPRRHGCELPRGGVTPTLPKVSARFLFSNDASGWYSWRLWTMDMVIRDFFVADANGMHIVDFEGETHSLGKNPLTLASPELLHLSNELQHRGPSRFREDE